MKIAIRVLAVLGAVFLVLLVVGIVLFFSWTSPSNPEADAPPAAPSAPSGQQLGEGDFAASNGRVEAGKVDTSAGPVTDVEATFSTYGSVADTTTATGLDAYATVPYATVEGAVGNGMKLQPQPDGQIAARIPVNVLGRTVTLIGTGAIQGEGRDLAFRPTEVGIEGGATGLSVPTWAADRLTFRYEVAALPPGLQISSITPIEGGFQVHVVADRLVLPND